MSKQNKTTKLAVLSLLGILGLTACGSSSSSEIYAKPTDYDNSIVTVTDQDDKEHGKDDIHNDVLSIIYDAIHEGDLSSKVLDKALYNFAESVLGVYNSVTRGSRELITLEEAANDDLSNTKINAFILSHKAYWLTNDEGKRVDEEGNIVDENATPCERERDRVRAKWTAVETRIAEEMYSRALSGSYTSKHFFKEADFVKALYRDGHNVDYDAAKSSGYFGVVPYTVEEDEVFEKGILHRKFYQDGIFDYIEKEIVPEVYSDLLVEQYLLDEDISAIRNSRARKINVIKIEKYSNFTNNADMLKKKLVDEIYANKPGDQDSMVRIDADQIEAYGEELFEKYATISKGLYNEIQNDPEALQIVTELQQIASDVYQEEVSASGISYYKNTTYGDLVEEFEELLEDIANNNWDDLDESLYSKYTSSGTRTVEEGFDQQRIDIAQKQSITKGWYIQNKEPSLDSNGTINDRLFKLSVANAKYEIGEGSDQALIDANIESLKEHDRFVKENGVWKLRDEWNDTNSFLCSINGAYYLKFENQYVGDDKRNDIVYDDGNAYYVVQVLEAVKDVKLRSTATGNYEATRGQQFMDEVIDEVAKILGETGNYATVSKNHWLEKMDITYHDQEVYDYFKSNYPELFD